MEVTEESDATKNNETLVKDKTVKVNQVTENNEKEKDKSDKIIKLSTADRNKNLEENSITKKNLILTKDKTPSINVLQKGENSLSNSSKYLLN